MQARSVKTKLVPEELRRECAEARLAAATGATLGIRGIVRANRVELTTRFSPRVAEAKFPALSERCRVRKTDGRFCWLKVPAPHHFAAVNHRAKAAVGAAEAAVNEILATQAGLEGFTPRTREHERLHDEFLKATQQVTRLTADLANLQGELTVRLGEDKGLVGVCSYKRYVRARIDRAQFCRTFPDEAARCFRSLSPCSYESASTQPDRTGSWDQSRRPVTTIANGSTFGTPARRRERAASVMVQPESTTSSTSNTGPPTLAHA